MPEKMMRTVVRPGQSGLRRTTGRPIGLTRRSRRDDRMPGSGPVTPCLCADRRFVIGGHGAGRGRRGRAGRASQGQSPARGAPDPAPRSGAGGGALYVDTLKNNRSRTVPLVVDLVAIVDRWSAAKMPDAWLFSAPGGGPLRESNWKRSVGWSAATTAARLHGFRVHDLRHTAASVWLGAGADPKVVQRVLGHATASMTMDLYGHLVDGNLWQAARIVGDMSGTSQPFEEAIEDEADQEPG